MAMDSPLSWTPAQRVVFRFLFSYLFLFFFPFPHGLVNPYWLGGVFDPIWNRLVPWGAGVLHTQLPAATSGGSGDTTFEYVRVILMLVIAALATMIWLVLDRNRTNYRVLHAW